MPQLYYPLKLSLVTEWPGDRGGWYHYGTDFGVPVNTPLRASFDGEIVFAGGDGASGQINGVWANGEGLTVDIKRTDGLIARYGHMNRIDVRVGQQVKAGQVIGLSGNTGFTTGPHTHWELRWDRAWSGGLWVDPRRMGAIEFPADFGASTVSAKKTGKEEDMRHVIVDNKHQFVIGQGYIHHIGSSKQADIAPRVIGNTSKIPNAEFYELVQAFDIPVSVYRLSDGYVQDPQNGNKFTKNGTWSRERQILGKLGVR